MQTRTYEDVEVEFRHEGRVYSGFVRPHLNIALLLIVGYHLRTGGVEASKFNGEDVFEITRAQYEALRADESVEIEFAGERRWVGPPRRVRVAETQHKLGLQFVDDDEDED